MSHRERCGCADPGARLTAAGLIVAISIAGMPAGSRAQSAVAGPEEMVVTSSRIPTPRRELATAVSVIDGAAIELRGYTALADALRTQPGVAVSNSGGAGKVTALRIRGEEGYRTLLVIDGVKALDPSAPQLAPTFENMLSTSDLARVEILRGPQGFMYGADAGGVVNVITADGEGPLGGRIGLESGSFDTHEIEGSLSGGGEVGDYFVSATDFETDGFNSSTLDTVLQDDDGAENTTVHAKLGWNATENLRVQLVARDIDASAMHDNCFSITTFASVHDCFATTEQTTYKVSAEHRAERLTNTFGYSDIDVASADESEGANVFATDGEISRFEYMGSFSPTELTTLVYGADLQTEHVESGQERERDQDGYYLEYQGKFDDRLFVTVGARYDDNEDFGTHTSSRLGIAYVQGLSAARTLKYRASYGTGFRAPSLFEIAYNFGPFTFPPAAGVELSEETSEGYDVGVEYDIPSGLHLELTYFDQSIEDEIYFDLASFSGYLQSLGTSKSEGVELGLKLPLGERWEILANWIHNDTADATSQPRLRRPKNLGNIGLQYEAQRLRVIMNYRLSHDAIDMGGIALDDYEVLDVSAAYSINGIVELFGRIQNVADESYQEVLDYNTAGREAYAGVRLRF